MIDWSQLKTAGQKAEDRVNEVQEARLRACAHPLTGSDRHFAEAARREALGDLEGAQTCKQAGLMRYEQIKQEHPWP